MFPEGTNEFATAVILAAFAYALPKLVELLTAAWKTYKESQPDVAWRIEEAAEKGVRLAEQTGFAAGVKKSGTEKLNLAVEFAAKWLAETSGVKVNDLLLKGAIEAAVNELFPKSK